MKLITAFCLLFLCALAHAEMDVKTGRVSGESNAILTNQDIPSAVNVIEKKMTNLFEVGIGTSFFFGYTLYQIGQYIIPPGEEDQISLPFEFSQLVFPLLTFTIDIDLSYTLSKYLKLIAKIKKNIPSVTGKMLDSDWGAWFLGGFPWSDYYTLDIQSESDTRLDMWKASAGLDIRVLNKLPFRMTCRPAIEFTRYYFTVSDLKQWYPSYPKYKIFLTPDYAGTNYQSGPVLTYTLNNVVLLLTGTAGFYWDNFSTALEFSPLIGFTWDADDHILRKKIAEGFLYQLGIRVAVALDLSLSENWSASARFEGDFQWGNGEQSQKRYENTSEGPAGAIGKVGEKTESVYGSVSLKAAYRF